MTTDKLKDLEIVLFFNSQSNDQKGKLVKRKSFCCSGFINER